MDSIISSRSVSKSSLAHLRRATTSPEECLRGLEELVDRIDGVTGLRLKLPSVTSTDSYDLLREMIQHIGGIAGKLSHTSQH